MVRSSSDKKTMVLPTLSRELKVRTFKKSQTFAHLLGATTLAFVAFASGPAQASLSSASVTLSAPGGIIGTPGPITATDTVSAGDGLKISAGDASNIGGTWMLIGEQISFSGNSISVTIASGGQLGNGDLVTGYLGSGIDHALYDFTGLDIAGQTINGLSASITGGGLIFPSGGSIYDYVHYLGPQEFTIDLDSLVFQDPGTGASNAFATLQVDLQTLNTPPPPPPSNVPEPASTSLLAMSGLALLWTQRRKQQGCDKSGK